MKNDMERMGMKCEEPTSSSNFCTTCLTWFRLRLLPEIVGNHSFPRELQVAGLRTGHSGGESLGHLQQTGAGREGLWTIYIFGCV